MKIICDKCNSEFLFNGDASRKNISMVRCPVCKTPITVRDDAYHAAKKRNEHDSQVFKNKNISHDADRMDPESAKGRAQENKGAGADISIQQDMISQIENGSDIVTDASDEFYDGVRVNDVRPKEETGVMQNLGTFLKNIDPYFIMDMYAPYLYYTFMIFFVFTSLFLFSDFIKLDNMGTHIDFWFHSLLFAFKHYV